MPEARTAFIADEQSADRTAQLSSEETELLSTRNWRGLIHYGVIFFVLEKLAAVWGLSNLNVCAAMRGQTLEAFLTTRNAPSALYSVGKEFGSHAQKLSSV